MPKAIIIEKNIIKKTLSLSNLNSSKSKSADLNIYIGHINDYKNLIDDKFIPTKKENIEIALSYKENSYTFTITWQEKDGHEAFNFNFRAEVDKKLRDLIFAQGKISWDIDIIIDLNNKNFNFDIKEIICKCEENKCKIPKPKFNENTSKTNPNRPLNKKQKIDSWATSLAIYSLKNSSDAEISIGKYIETTGTSNRYHINALIKYLSINRDYLTQFRGRKIKIKELKKHFEINIIKPKLSTTNKEVDKSTHKINIFKEVKKEANEIKESEIHSKERKIRVRPSSAQNKFKKHLLFKYNKCAFCNIELPILIEAAHISDVSKQEKITLETYSINNGILACRNHHKLFDEKEIRIENNGDIFLKKEIKGLNTNEKLHDEYLNNLDKIKDNLKKKKDWKE